MNSTNRIEGEKLPKSKLFGVVTAMPFVNWKEKGIRKYQLIVSYCKKIIYIYIINIRNVWLSTSGEKFSRGFPLGISEYFSQVGLFSILILISQTINQFQFGPKFKNVSSFTTNHFYLYPKKKITLNHVIYFFKTRPRIFYIFLKNEISF